MRNQAESAWDDLPWQDKSMVGISAFKDIALKERLVELLA
jgi:hypothetical protein